ncbi:putative nuclease HARBI1 isoform X1 [Lytechinus variegatus]|uniref:putative nuclease HARBI1 isoform X1 n=2 Tax=Lytechinus variegatus TaxID=7654 RepID=UPI001BB0F4A6|nr:putative nuclease HARBI1 isoform X1 [Lytechinus variegatus]XP_041455632.1 putative nuclease HARBI1 isoform X1 [Lytechinus variegatus]
MADLLAALRRGEQMLEINRRQEIERPLVERKNPFHIYENNDFQQRYRFTKQSALHIIEELTPALERHTSRTNAVPVYLQVLTAMRFYAVGTFQLLHGDECGLSQSSLSRIIVQVSTEIARWRRRYIHFPNTPEQVARTQEEFFQYCDFPGVVGAIDCTHVPIRCPGGENAQRFINRKGRFSVNVQAVCNHNGLLINLVARWPGGTHDSRIFRECQLKENLERESHEEKWLLGDSGYPCQPYLMTPIQNPAGRGEIRYNRAQVRGRNIIERTFGMMKRRFPCMNELRLKLDTTLITIVAVGVLWNLSILRNEPEIAGPDGIQVPGDQLPPPGMANVAGHLRRQRIIQDNFV